MDMIGEFFQNLMAVMNTFEFKDAIDILAITFVIYSAFKLVRQTRAEQLLKGILIMLVVYLVSIIFNLAMLTRLITMFFEFGVIIVFIVFQPEIRKALEKIGNSKISVKSLRFIKQTKRTPDWIENQKLAIKEVSCAAKILSRSKTGALIVFESHTMLSDIASSGTVVDSKPSVAILGNIFFNKAPLHDGAVIIRDGRVYAAGCILPLTDDKTVDINLGTRHRAAIGMSENSDAVVVVVSEETGVISLAVAGRLQRNLSQFELEKKLVELLIPEEFEKNDFFSKFSFKSKEKGENTDEK